MIIIGITGTLGAGKGTIVDYLVRKYCFNHFSVREYLIKEIEKNKMAVNRDSMVIIANRLREKNSPSFIVDELYKRSVLYNKNAIIESIRTLGEVYSLRKSGNFLLMAINADIKIRYDRITKRQSETDNISFETFVLNEEREYTANDPNKQNIAACIEASDVVFNNNGCVEELYEQVDNFLNNKI